MNRSQSNYELYSEEGPLKHYNIECKRVYRNAPTAFLYEQALKYEKGTAIMANGAIQTRSGKHTGRSPKDKRIVATEETKDIWWGDVNIALNEEGFKINKERAVDYLNTRERLYITDCYAGHDPENRIKIRLVTARAYHALFLTNMLIKPTEEELKEDFEDSIDFIIYNAGEFPANRFTTGMTSKASVALNFKTREMIILGTQYAGEMKKGVFTVMHYLMPLKNNLSLHSSCNQSMKDKEDVALFFGLSGTGKTTLSTDQHRYLIGDDEHVWTDKGVFNIEGGCYAKCDGLKEENEPDIYRAIRYGAVVENVVYDESTRQIDFNDLSITQNTRCAYPLNYIANAKIPAVTKYHPKNIILLTCDAFGVLPPVTKLTSAQAMYHFISGYTAKVAGTEVGITKPTATFSACFGSPFLIFHPQRYANLLAEKMEKFNCHAYLVNTGWIEGSAESGVKRCPLKYTRMIIDAIHGGKIREESTEFEKLDHFGLAIPKTVEGVPDSLLNPRNLWEDKEAYGKQLKHLAGLFKKNFAQFADGASKETLAAGPQ